MIGILIAAIVGVLVGRDAKKYRMNTWAWGIFVFLILIIGLPAYFIVRENKKKKIRLDSEDILDV
tara:strand:- start:728 stop:922 length:195 start_codon:yes stop_codon:yes gene_type:complete